jgi:diguanylate cyclase (GGDEF)-like protein
MTEENSQIPGRVRRRTTENMTEEAKTRITHVRIDTPRSSEPACLVLIYPTGATMGKRFPLEQDGLIIGRVNSAEISVDLDSVSRRHARIERRPEGVVISDLGSTNGTYVNQLQVRERVLCDGDQIKIGNAIFKFLSGGNVEASYHEAIYRMTIIDGLTEAYNVRFLKEFLEREVARCSRYNRPLSVVMYDLDHFKRINDTHGHLAGDFTLREITRRLKTRIRREEILARYGGEEFVVVLPEADHAGAMKFAEQIRSLVEDEPIEFEEEKITITISVGVATVEGDWDKDKMDPDHFIKQVDENLYQAKRSGRNCVVG